MMPLNEGLVLTLAMDRAGWGTGRQGWRKQQAPHPARNLERGWCFMRVVKHRDRYMALLCINDTSNFILQICCLEGLVW